MAERVLGWDVGFELSEAWSEESAESCEAGLGLGLAVEAFAAFAAAGAVMGFEGGFVFGGVVEDGGVLRVCACGFVGGGGSALGIQSKLSGG